MNNLYVCELIETNNDSVKRYLGKDLYVRIIEGMGGKYITASEKEDEKNFTGFTTGYLSSLMINEEEMTAKTTNETYVFVFEKEYENENI